MRLMTCLLACSLTTIHAKADNAWLGTIPIDRAIKSTRAPTDLTPAIATVITKDEMVTQGYEDLSDALKAIPGLHMGEAGISVRGFTTSQSANILFLVDGQQRLSVPYGSFRNYYGSIPIESIERIEIIRGPTTAAYGQNALSATINIVTMLPASIPTAANIATSKDLKRFYVSASKPLGSGNSAIIAHGKDYDGWKDYIQADLQTGIDMQLPAPISLAPGFANHAIEEGGLEFRWSNINWTLSSRYSVNRDVGLGVGILPVLDKAGHVERDIFDNSISRVFSIGKYHAGIRARYNRSAVRLFNTKLFPDGAFGIFDNGVTIEGEYVDQAGSIGGFVTTPIGADHELTADLEISAQNIDVSDLVRNYTTDSELGYVPAESADFDDEKKSVARTYLSLRLQDSFRISPKTYVTAGVSVDKLDSEKLEASPRLTLAHNFAADWSMKLLWGRGLRYPTILESEDAFNAPAIVANPNVRPEKLESTDIQASWEYGPHRLSMNAFYHQTVDQINNTDAGVLGVYPLNTGTQYGHGAEVDYGYALDGKNMSLFMSYHKNTIDGEDVGYAPRAKIGLLYSTKITSDVSIGARVVMTGRSDRPPGDQKPSTHSYTRSDINVIWTPANKYSLALRVQNVFNDSTKEPNFHAASPFDIGLPGRSATISISMEF